MADQDHWVVPDQIVWVVTYIDDLHDGDGQRHVAGVFTREPEEHELDRYYGGEIEITEVEVDQMINISKGNKPWV